jgi:hypothetical protein
MGKMASDRLRKQLLDGRLGTPGATSRAEQRAKIARLRKILSTYGLQHSHMDDSAFLLWCQQTLLMTEKAFMAAGGGISAIGEFFTVMASIFTSKEG